MTRDTQQWPWEWKRSFSFQSQRKAMPKNVQPIAQLHSSHTSSKVMLKILQARLQQKVNHKIPDVQAGFRKGRRNRAQIANIRWIIEKAREFQKNICFVDYAKAFDYVGHKTLWKILQEMGIADHLTCLLRNLYAGQEATVRTGHGTPVLVAQLCLTLCNPMDCRPLGFSVHGILQAKILE